MAEHVLLPWSQAYSFPHCLLLPVQLATLSPAAAGGEAAVLVW